MWTTGRAPASRRRMEIGVHRRKLVAIRKAEFRTGSSRFRVEEQAKEKTGHPKLMELRIVAEASWRRVFVEGPRAT